MTHSFPEVVIGGVLLAPFILYAVEAFVVLLLVRPVLRITGYSKLFSHPAIAELSLYVTILGVLTVAF
jgi:hypothetical protein